MEGKKIVTRRQIMEGAFTCFSRYGYTKTTFLDVAGAAGISRALIYIYFKNKEDLFVKTINEKHENYARLSAEVIQSDLSNKKKLRKIIDIWVIDPYRIINRSPVPNAWLDQLKNASESEKVFRGLFVESLTPLLGQGLAEIVVLAFRGLMDDRPPITVLKKRTAILIKNIYLIG